jgi:hypothetical protein
METQTKSYGIEEATMLMTTSVSVWTARKLDRGASEEVMDSKNAGSRGAARVNKNLMAGRTELEEIQKVAGAARTYVYANTAPWSDAGQRWIPTARLLKVDKRMQEFKQEFEDKVSVFCNAYSTLITAQAMALGAMFNRAEYPNTADVHRKFSFTYDFEPLPSIKDFRVDIPADAQADLRERLEGAMNRRMDNALGDIRKQLGDHLKRMAERLVSVKDDKTGEMKQQRFHDTLVTSAYDLCDLIKDFNVTGDKDLSDMRNKLECALGGTTAETLRNDYTKREEVLVEVKEMLDAWSF